MHSLHILYQLVLADFKERTRRYSYLITLLVSLFLGYLVLTDKYSFRFGPFMPEYNSHWIGTIMALAGAAMFAIMGFYIVRSSISRDRDTRVGEILATTNLSSITYLLSKFISNLLVLWSMVGALAVIAFLGMLFKVPFENINFIAFVNPFLFLPLTLTITVAGAAVLFDTVRWLRGITGNVLYFFFAEFMIISGLFKIPYFDGAGMGLFEVSVRNAISAVYPGEKIPMAIGFVRIFEDETIKVASKLFVWDGIDWTSQLMLSRLVWPAIAFGMFLIAIILFDRFEQSKKVFAKKSRKKKSATSLKGVEIKQAFDTSLYYKNIPTVKYTSNIISKIKAELNLNLKQIKPIWLFIGLGLVISELFVPFEIARKFIVPSAMIWPLILWSSISTKEEQYNMRSIMFCSADVHSKQFIAMLLTGIFIATTMCMPMLIRAAIIGEYTYLMLLISAILLIPTTAFAFGIVSRSKKLFEVLYLMIWYGGSIDRIKPIDLLGTSDESTGYIRIFLFFLLAISSAIIAYIGRRKRV